MKITAVICAAGRGERAGFSRNKLLVPLGSAPALWLTLEKFASEKIKPVKEITNPSLYKDGFDEVLVTASPEDKEEIERLCAPFGFKTVTGGATRTESVYNALKQATGDIVIIHDGARPYITDTAIAECIECVKEHGSAVCALPVTDTTAIVCDGRITSVPQRRTVYSLQTPQGFYLSNLLAAYGQAAASGESFTDDSSVYLRYVGAPHIFIGSEKNVKLTFKKDFDLGGAVMPEVTGKRLGIGADTHAFGKEQDYVTLCGVKIPCDKGLIAHSDGDVAVHAVMDALLSAAGLRDIGYYFPDADEKFLNADSLKLLKEVVQLIRAEGFTPASVSVSIQAEKPRIGKFTDEMKQTLAEALNIDKKAVGITAGTCEGLGYIGRGLGITVTAVAVLN